MSGPDEPDPWLAVAALVGRPTWMSHAACRGSDPAQFVPTRRRSVGGARAVCARCPVREACLEFALADERLVGIWGGTSTRERAQLRRGDNPGS